MSEEIRIEEDEKIIVTKKKRQASQNQLKALEKARNLKAIKREAAKIVGDVEPKIKETIRYIEKPIEKPKDNFFLMGLVGLTAIVATYVITINKNIIKNTLETVKQQNQTQEEVKETPQVISSQEPLKKVSRCSNLVLEF